MDKTIANTVKKVMGEGEKVAPVKSIKLKVKFQKEDMAEKIQKKMEKKGNQEIGAKKRSIGWVR